MGYSLDCPDSGDGYFPDNPLTGASDYEASFGNQEFGCK